MDRYTFAKHVYLYGSTFLIFQVGTINDFHIEKQFSSPDAFAQFLTYAFLSTQKNTD